VKYLSTQDEAWRGAIPSENSWRHCKVPMRRYVYDCILYGELPNVDVFQLHETKVGA
jgi:hypothetical protein